MKNNEEFGKYIKWALESEENKKQAIQNACSLISFLSKTDKKDISEEELKKIAGGSDGIEFCYGGSFSDPD